MSWNKPSEAPKPVQKKKPSVMHGIVAKLEFCAFQRV